LGAEILNHGHDLSVQSMGKKEMILVQPGWGQYFNLEV